MVCESLNMLILLNILRYVFLFGIVLFVSGLFAHQSWILYASIFNDGGSSWIDLSDIAGFAFNYALLAGIMIWGLGEHYRQWILVLVYIPLLIYEYGVDFDDVKIILHLSILGIVIGFLIRYIADRTLGKIPSFEPLKKYF